MADSFKELREALARVDADAVLLIQGGGVVRFRELRALLAALDAAEARARDMEAQRDEARAFWMAQAEARKGAASEYLHGMTEAQRDRDAAQARVRRMSKALSALLKASPEPYFLSQKRPEDDDELDTMMRPLWDEARAALADGADKDG